MTERIDISSLVPEGYRKVINLDGYVGQHLEQPLGDIVRLRASQLNGCTFCVDMHSVDLQTAEVPVRKIFSVTTWRESEWFTERERIALELTEQITLIQGGVSDELFARAREEFGDEGLSNLILAIGTINIWNRIAIPTLMAPPAL
jgi:AhpD family alkylhydroperoxidase